MNIKKLTRKEYLATCAEKMSDITAFAEEIVYIWDYVKLLDKSNCFLNDYIIEKELVEYVYRNSKNTFEHVLIPTVNKNIYLVMVIEIDKKEIFGHYLLDLNKEYGIEKKSAQIP